MKFGSVVLSAGGVDHMKTKSPLAKPINWWAVAASLVIFGVIGWSVEKVVDFVSGLLSGLL